MSRYVDLSEKVTATFFDEEYGEWSKQTVTVADILDSVCDGYTVLPSAQSKTEISYIDCSNAMLKMWMDNVLTDGEYNRIMDKLNTHHDAERRKDG